MGAGSNVPFFVLKPFITITIGILESAKGIQAVSEGGESSALGAPLSPLHPSLAGMLQHVSIKIASKILGFYSLGDQA